MITNPPISEIGFECLFNLPSGLSKRTKKFEIELNFKKKIKLNKNINRIKKKTLTILICIKFIKFYINISIFNNRWLAFHDKS